MTDHLIESEGMIAVLSSGDRIAVIPGEGADEQCFAGEKLNPTEREIRIGAHVSCLWLRSAVVKMEANPTGERE